MTAIVAPARVACHPQPFLLSDMFDAVGQLVVVPDENWNELLAWTKKHLLLPDRAVTIIETERGPFLVIPDEDIDQNRRIS